MIFRDFRKNADGKIEDVRTLDLQLSRLARPSIDLAYFFGSSLSPQLRHEEGDRLMKLYHTTLVKKLVGLGYPEDLYTFQDLKDDYKECLPFKHIMSIMHAMVHFCKMFYIITCIHQIFCSQIQLTPPDADVSEGGMDMDQAVTEPEQMKEWMDNYRQGQIKQAKKNEKLRDRLIQIGREASADGVI